jgi:hypothetical protein
VDQEKETLADVPSACKLKKAKGKVTSKRKRSVNEPAKDTPAEKDMHVQQEMHVEQHTTPVKKEFTSDPEPIQREALLADVHARCKEEG